MNSNQPQVSTDSFNEFGLHPDLLKAIVSSGYVTPTPIQKQAIPAIINGRDIMGAAQTGTGKTAAFTLPLLHRLMPVANNSASPARHPVRALILTPTRELADQVADNVKRYSAQSPLRVAVVFGGVDINQQKVELRKGCELLIATPGRLLDHIEQKNVSLAQVSVLVLDEADRMLDMGFMPDLEKIVRLLPKSRQSLLFSATFSTEIRKLARNFLNDPLELEVAARNTTAANVSQIVYPVEHTQKKQAVIELLKARNDKQVIVFANTKISTSALARELAKEGFKADSIHGDKSQAERIRTLEEFKSGNLMVLVATDVAARGLDVAGLPCVINADLPFNAEDYVHRIGRTGRAGSAGEAIGLFTPNEEKFLLDIEKLIKTKIERGTLALPKTVATFHPKAVLSENRQRRKPQGFKSGPVDKIFVQPYEPSKQSTQAIEKNHYLNQQHKNDIAQKQVLAVLLGGRPVGFEDK